MHQIEKDKLTQAVRLTIMIGREDSSKALFPYRAHLSAILVSGLVVLTGLSAREVRYEVLVCLIKKYTPLCLEESSKLATRIAKR